MVEIPVPSDCCLILNKRTFEPLTYDQYSLVCVICIRVYMAGTAIYVLISEREKQKEEISLESCFERVSWKDLQRNDQGAQEI